jgi:hypothetical protein
LARTGATVRVQIVGDEPHVLLAHGASNGGTTWASLAARLPAIAASSSTVPAAG